MRFHGVSWGLSTERCSVTWMRSLHTQSYILHLPKLKHFLHMPTDVNMQMWKFVNHRQLVYHSRSHTLVRPNVQVDYSEMSERKKWNLLVVHYTITGVSQYHTSVCLCSSAPEIEISATSLDAFAQSHIWYCPFSKQNIFWALNSSHVLQPCYRRHKSNSSGLVIHQLLLFCRHMTWFCPTSLC